MAVINGICLGTGTANLYPIKNTGANNCANQSQNPRQDLLVIQLAQETNVAGVFTQNKLCAAPVKICRAHLAKRINSKLPIRALVINTGNANAGTGDLGLKSALAVCDALANLLEISPNQILPFSTGVILEALPVDKIIATLPQAIANSHPDNWTNAAIAIMTTDTRPKIASRTISIDKQIVKLTGIAKGSGMVKPNMATMLAFVASDAKISTTVLEQLIKLTVEKSFNCITVDGDTSTNDSFILIASGAANMQEIKDLSDPNCKIFQAALCDLAQELAQMIVRDGEGASKFICIKVEDGKNEAECKQVAYAIAHSPLVKTAFFAGDPNLGRILAAIGNCGIDDLCFDKLNLWLDDLLIAENGCRHQDYQEIDGKTIMSKNDITVRVSLGRGLATTNIWTCDLSHDYISINASYRS